MTRQIIYIILILAITTIVHAYDLITTIPDNKVQYLLNSYKIVYGEPAEGESNVEYMKRMRINEIRRTCLKAEKIKSRSAIDDIVATETSDFGVE